MNLHCGSILRWIDRLSAGGCCSPRRRSTCWLTYVARSRAPCSLNWLWSYAKLPDFAGVARLPP